MKIRLDRTISKDSDQSSLTAFYNGKITTRKLSQAVNLGSIASWKVKANKKGCGGFSVSVWDEARVAPLDNVEFTFGVAAPGHPAPECGMGSSYKAMGSGMETLLIGPLGAGNEETMAHAAMHLFEFKDGDKIRSVIVFVDRAKLKTTQSGSDDWKDAIFAWTTDSPISSYMTSASGLPALINQAHQSVKFSTNPHLFRRLARDCQTPFSGVKPTAIAPLQNEHFDG